MKKFLTLLCIFAMPAFMNAQLPHQSRPIPFIKGYVNPTKPWPGHPKSPVVEPTVYIDGNVLTFETPCDGCVLQLVDEDDEVVYTIIIPVGTTTLVLPSYISGTFELQIIDGEWMFYADIEL